MNIVELYVKNVKGTREITVRPTGPVVEVCGENEAGKSSLMDAIWWGVAGARNIQAKPIRDGETEAIIKLDLGPVTVKRIFSDRGPGERPVSRVEVRNADGGLYKSPQRMLDDMLSALSMDPMAFVLAKPAEQARRILEIAGVNFREHDALMRRDYELRRDHNRDMKRLQATASTLKQEHPPEAKVDVSALTEELGKAHNFNQTRDTVIQDRATKLERIPEIDKLVDEKLAEAQKLVKEAAALRDEQRSIELTLAETLPDPVDTQSIQDQVNAAGEINLLFDQEHRYQRHLREAGAHGRVAFQLDGKIEARKASLEQKLAESPLPVDQLTVVENEVCYRQIPLAQCSDAMQLRVACAITMADNPDLKVIRIRHGSLLDDKSMGELAEMAEAEGWQVWIERVGERSVGECAVILREGQVAA